MSTTCTTCNSGDTPVKTYTATPAQSGQGQIALGLGQSAKLPMKIKLPVQLARYNGGRKTLVITSPDQLVKPAVRDYLRNHATHGDLFASRIIKSKRTTGAESEAE